MKVVIDTNVFILSFFGGKPKKIIDLWKHEKITVCLSGAILDEYFEVLRRIGMKDERELELEELMTFLAKGFNVLFTTKTPRIKIVKNDPDDKFIECAVALKADVIITGDKEVLAIKDYMGIEIVTSGTFLEKYEL